MKKAFLITYDLKTPAPDYDEIIRIIKEDCAGAWCKYWESSFLITSALTPKQILDKLTPFLRSEDSLLVIEVVNNKNGWLTQRQWDWINKNIFPEKNG